MCSAAILMIAKLGWRLNKQLQGDSCHNEYGPLVTILQNSVRWPPEYPPETVRLLDTRKVYSLLRDVLNISRFFTDVLGFMFLLAFRAVIEVDSWARRVCTSGSDCDRR